MTFIKHLLPLQGPLRKFWCPERFTFKDKRDTKHTPIAGDDGGEVQKPGTLDWAARQYASEETTSANKEDENYGCTTAQQIRQITAAHLMVVNKLHDSLCTSLCMYTSKTELQLMEYQQMQFRISDSQTC